MDRNFIVKKDDRRRRFAFEGATIDNAGSILRESSALLEGKVMPGFVLDLSKLVEVDSFGITYLAACVRAVVAAKITGFVRRPRSEDLHRFLLDVGLYEEIGISERFGPRTLSKDRVDIIHIKQLEPLFIDYLLDFLETMQPFERGLRPSIRMALMELVQNFAEHAGSRQGAWASGQLNAQRDRMTLGLLDLGKGIPDVMRTIPGFRRLGDAKLIELSTEEGISSAATTPRARGLGLAMIRRFVKSNSGTLTILAARGIVRFPPEGRPVLKSTGVRFRGTAGFMSLVPTRRGLFALDE
jgi:hypothetical protein